MGLKDKFSSKSEAYCVVFMLYIVLVLYNKIDADKDNSL